MEVARRQALMTARGGVHKMPIIKAQMTGIQEMDLSALRDEWRRHYRASPPRRLSRDLLIRGIAYKL